MVVLYEAVGLRDVERTTTKLILVTIMILTILVTPRSKGDD